MLTKFALLVVAVALTLSGFLVAAPDAKAADYWPKPGQAKLYRYDDGMFRLALGGSESEAKPYRWRVFVNGTVVLKAAPRNYRIRLIERTVTEPSVIEVFRNNQLRYVWGINP